VEIAGSLRRVCGQTSRPVSEVPYPRLNKTSLITLHRPTIKMSSLFTLVPDVPRFFKVGAKGLDYVI
jgi:hypothetical protein